jgi:hypothetical protein
VSAFGRSGIIRPVDARRIVSDAQQIVLFLNSVGTTHR